MPSYEYLWRSKFEVGGDETLAGLIARLRAAADTLSGSGTTMEVPRSSTGTPACV